MLSKTGRIWICRVFLCVLAFIPALLFGLACVSLPVLAAATRQPVLLSSGTAKTTASGNVTAPEKYSPPLIIEHSANSAAVIATSRLQLLYDKNADSQQNIPAASKIMTALIACEKLALDTQITISKVAAAADANRKTGDGVDLKTGNKYPLEYLLLRLVYYNSDAAALAIAEQIANVESKFVDLMNAKVKSINLADTVFLNCTGAAVVDSKTAASLQYTTPAKLAHLVSYAILNKNFAKIFTSKNEYLLLSGQVFVSMSNELQNVWTLSEGKITGAFYCELDKKSYMIAVGKVNDIGLVAVTAGGDPKSRITDLLSLFQGCADSYVFTPLVEEGDAFPGETERTVDGESFGLIYKNTVYYVHPVDDLFIKQSIRYNSFGPSSKPILRSMTVGQVIIELKDGTAIAVDVCPDRQILSSISILDKALGELQNNRNLSVIILAAFGCLLLVMLTETIIGARKLVHLIWLVILEKRSRR